MQFSIFRNILKIFDLSEYYRSATDQEVSDFTSNEQLCIENPEAFQEQANTAIRRKIAMINDSRVLIEHTPNEIRKLARQTGIIIKIKDNKIVIPNDKEQVKVILGFLDEEAYKGPFSHITYLANSKRKV